MVSLLEHVRRSRTRRNTIPRSAAKTVAELACNESYEPRAGSYIEHVSRRWRQMSFNGSNPRLVFGAFQAGHVAWIRIIERCDGTPEGGDAFLHIAVVRGSGAI